jgi:GntR family transcriptional regulator, transcriptional repressor for pyruvate dehydrogenase complex
MRPRNPKEDLDPMSPSTLQDKITPLQNLSLVDEVELRLMKFLVESELTPGDPLPKEVELAEAFGVSRTVIREALTRLKVMGLVQSIKHKGSVVTHPDVPTIFERVLHPQILDEDTRRDIFEIRLVLEVGMADLLFARLTRADLDELDAIVADEPEQADSVFASDFEVRFHGKLYAISGNQTLRSFQAMLLPVFAYVHENGRLKSIEPGQPFVTHRRLVEILRSGTPEQFREAMRQHLDNQFRRIL